MNDSDHIFQQSSVPQFVPVMEMGGMGYSVPSGLSEEGGCRGEEIQGWHAVVRQERG